jgi:hypothetical protein
MDTFTTSVRRGAAGAVTAAAALLLAAAPALAQGITSADVDDVELESFTMALEEVVEIQAGMQVELEGASDAEAQEIRTSFNAELVEAIEGHDIEVPRFNAIAGSLEQDPELSQRVSAKRAELRGAGTTDGGA